MFVKVCPAGPRLSLLVVLSMSSTSLSCSSSTGWPAMKGAQLSVYVLVLMHMVAVYVELSDSI